MVALARLAAVGNVHLGDRVGLAIGAVGTRYPWTSVAPVLRRADIAVANFERAVSTRGAPVPKQHAVANNHSLDFGRLAFADTLRYAHDYGMKTIGEGANLTAPRRPAVIRAGGLKVALIGGTYGVRPELVG